VSIQAEAEGSLDLTEEFCPNVRYPKTTELKKPLQPFLIYLSSHYRFPRFKQYKTQLMPENS